MACLLYIVIYFIIIELHTCTCQPILLDVTTIKKGDLFHYNVTFRNKPEGADIFYPL